MLVIQFQKITLIKFIAKHFEKETIAVRKIIIHYYYLSFQIHFNFA